MSPPYLAYFLELAVLTIFYEYIERSKTGHCSQQKKLVKLLETTLWHLARRDGSDGSMSASGPAGSGFDPRRSSKFSFDNFQPRG